MAYQYHYTGDLDVSLPTFHLNAVGGDKEAVYETTEPINHPEFVLVKGEQVEEVQPEATPTEPEQPQETVAEEPHEEEIQTENVSEGETAQVE